MTLKREWDVSDFEQLSWHDCALHAIIFDIDEPSFRGDLILDIDFITQWLCQPDRTCQFLIAPATLVFHHVTDLGIRIPPGDSGFQVSLTNPCIHVLARERIQDQKVCLDRPYYKWMIALNTTALIWLK